MASTLEIIIKATDQASPVFKQVAENSKISKQLGQQGQQGGEAYSKGLADGIAQGMKNAEKAADNAAKNMTNSMKNTAKAQSNVLKEVESMTRDTYQRMGKDFDAVSKDMQQKSLDATRKIIANNEKAGYASRKSFEEMGKKAEEVITGIHNAAAQDVVLEASFEAGKAIADAESLKAVLKRMPNAVINVGLNGADKALSEVKNLNHEAVEMEARGLTIDIATRGARMASKRLLGLETQGMKLNAQKIVVEASVRGARLATKHLWDVFVAKERVGDEPSEVQVLLKGLEGVLTGFKKIGEEGRDLQAERVELTTHVKNVTSSIKSLLKIGTTAEDVGNQSVSISAGMANLPQFFTSLSDIKDRVKKASEQTATFMTDLEGESVVASSLQKLRKVSNQITSDPLIFTTTVLGAMRVSKVIDGLSGQKRDLSSTVAKIGVGVVGAAAAANAIGSLSRGVRDLTSTPAEIRARWHGEEAQREIERSQDLMRELNEMNATPEVQLEAKKFGWEIGIIKKQMETADRLSALPNVEISGQAKEELVGLRRRLEEIDNQTSAPLIVLERYEKVKRQLDETEKKFAQLNLRKIKASMSISGIAPSISGLNSIQDGIASIDKRKAYATVGVIGVTTALGALASFRAGMREVDNAEIAPQVELDNFFGAMGQLKLIDSYISRLNRRNISIGVDATAALVLPKILGDSLAILGHFETVAAAIHAVTVPALIGGIGALGGAFATLGAAAVSAGAELAPGFVAAIGAVGGAIGAGAIALKSYQSALAYTRDYSRDLTQTLVGQFRTIEAAGDNISAAKEYLNGLQQGTKEYEDASRAVTLAQTQENHEIEKFGVMISSVGPKQTKLIGDLHGMEMGMIRLGGAIREEIAPYMSRWIDIGSEKMDELRPKIIGFIGDMNKVTDSMIKAATSGNQWNRTVKVLDMIRSVGTNAMSVVGNSAMIAINAFALMNTEIRQVSTGLARATESARLWTQSTQGQETLNRIWSSMSADMDILWRATGHFAIALGQVFSSLSQASLADSLLQRMLSLSMAFREATAAGTQGRASLNEFFASMRPIIGAATSLGGTVVTEAARVINAVITMGGSGKQLNPLVSILNHTENAVRSVASLIIHNFASLGPRMGPLIENLAKLARVFLASIPPLEKMIDLFNVFAGWFTKMTFAQQRHYASMVSWSVLLLMVAKGPIARLAAGLLKVIGILGVGYGKAFGTASKAMKPFAKVFNGLMKVFIGFKSFGLIVPLLTAMTGPFGAVAVAIGILVVAASGLIANWDTLNARLSGGKGIEGAKSNLMSFASTLSQQVLAKFKQVVGWIKSNWPQIKTVIVSVAESIWSFVGPIFKSIGSVMVSAFRGFMGILPSLKAGFGSLATMLASSLGPTISNFIEGITGALPILKPLGAFVGGLLVGAFKALWPIVVIVAKVLGGTFLVALRAVSIGVRMLGNFIGDIGRFLTPLSPILNGVGQVIGYVFATVIVGAVGKGIQAIAGLFKWGPQLMSFFGRFSFFSRAVNWVFKAFDVLGGAIVAFASRIPVIGRVFNAVIGRIPLIGDKLVAFGARLPAIGQMLISGLIGGVIRAPGALLRALVHLASMAWNGLKNFLGINSPSKKFMQIGDMIVQGLIQGIKRMISAVPRVLISIGAALLKAAFGLGKRIGQALVGIARNVVNTVRGVFTKLLSIAKDVFNKLPNVVQAPLRRIGGVIGPIIKIWGRLFVTNFKIIVNAVREAMSIIGKVIKIAMVAIRAIFLGAWKIIKGIFTGNMNSIKQGAQLFSAGLKLLFSVLAKGLRALWDVAWKAIKAVFKNTMSAIRAAANTWADNIKKLFSDAGSFLKKLWDTFWKFMKGLWDGALSSISKRVDTWISNAKKNWDAFRGWLRGLWEKLWNKIKEIIDSALSAVAKRIDRWWENAKSTFETIREGVKTAFEKVGRSIYEPIESAFGTLKKVWNGILEFIASGLGKIGADDMAKKVRGMKVGDSDSSNDRVRKMATGGVIAQPPIGGVADGYTPRVVYGEVGKPESYAVHGDKRSLPYAQAYLDTVDYRAVPEAAVRSPLASGENPRLMATGGVLGNLRKAGATFYAAGGTWDVGGNTAVKWLADANSQIESKFPVNGTTYSGHGAQGNSMTSVDYLTSEYGWGTNAGPKGKQLGDSLVSYMEGNLQSIIDYLIWDTKANYGNGWQQYVGGGGYGYPTTPSGLHTDHVHMSVTPGGENQGYAPGGGGGFLPSRQEIFSGIWDKTIQPFINRLVDFPGSHVMSVGAEKFVEDKVFGTWVKDKVIGLLPGGSGGGSGFSGGGDPAKNRELGKKMNEAAGWGNQWSALDNLWTKESGWNHLADNPTSNAYGIPQAMTTVHAMPKGYGPPGGDPATQIDWGLNYIRDNHGDPNGAWGHSQSVGWYGKGGVTGRGKQRLTMEPQVRRAFTTVAHTLNSMAGNTPRANLAIGDNGGVGTGKSMVAITNEAGPEAIVPKNRTRQGQEALRQAIRWHGVPQMADGGLVGSDRFVGFNGSSKYMSLVGKGANAWDNLGVVGFGKGNDVRVTDAWLGSGTLGRATSYGNGSGKIELNTALLDKYPIERIQSTVSHEMGHIGGLEHQNSGLMSTPSYEGRPSFPGGREKALLEQIHGPGRGGGKEVFRRRGGTGTTSSNTSSNVVTGNGGSWVVTTTQNGKTTTSTGGMSTGSKPSNTGGNVPAAKPIAAAKKAPPVPWYKIGSQGNMPARKPYVDPEAFKIGSAGSDPGTEGARNPGGIKALERSRRKRAEREEANQRNTAKTRKNNGSENGNMTFNLGNLTINEAKKMSKEELLEEIGAEVERRVKKVVNSSEKKGKHFSGMMSSGDSLG